MGLSGRANRMSIKWLAHRDFNPASHDMSSLMARPLRLGRLWSRSPCSQVAAFGTLAVRLGHPERTKEGDLMNFINRMRAFVRDSSGQDLLEYALLVALIALVCVAVITTTGSNVKEIFDKISTELGNATP